ncbi:leucine-rich repeat-containing protein kinase family protein [Hymenobacter endophyticus]|uniref:Leucine-rich repeat-containing protein kinase family protein n=1 Tax=Hymenobacter endophyticus TaxID=3076335 RepID=A0ABU3TC22_9BACT|nr:leucine-rich repeat-containing protein kinase family protein [Hymenobacter endophyticus]MDU0368894.1 leucine-rich repeat-containing protein kinase family protein [Hymenobacter endophyticus]
MHTLQQLRAGELAGATRLDLREGLSEFPREIFELADTLEILNLSGNALRALPADLPRLRKLRILFCSENQFTEVPSVLGQCPELSMVGFKANQIHTLPGEALPPRLRWLILTDNQLTALPAEIGRCRELQKLMLAGNQLRELPPELGQCHQLELLRLAANQLTALPGWLLRLPRLSWLAYAGNPFAVAFEEAALALSPIREISWDEIELQHVLGEGASGIISQATWQTTPVAVKLFKGAVTSDGLPHSEMVACIRAGTHPHLIPVLGKVVRHPTNAEGLVLELISPEFGNLAGPPSFSTCTRDVYGADTTFSLATVVRITQGIAAATAHLHSRGILHGDLYAHNILVAADGGSLLGDFGAAGFFNPASSAAAMLQRLEVRAFGCLLEELLDLCSEATPDNPTAQYLRGWQQHCLLPLPEARPLFSDINQALQALPLQSSNS